MYRGTHYKLNHYIVLYQIIRSRKMCLHRRTSQMIPFCLSTFLLEFSFSYVCKVSPPPFSLCLSLPLPPHPDRVTDLIRHWVRLHYAVLTDKRIAKQLFSFPLSPPRGCVSKRRTSLSGQISLFILIRGLQYWLHFIGSEISHQWSAARLLVLFFLRAKIQNIRWNEVKQGENLLRNVKHLNHFGQVLNVELLPEIPPLKPCLVQGLGW